MTRLHRVTLSPFHPFTILNAGGEAMNPGEILIDEAAAAIAANADRATVTLLVQNSGDRPIQVGSHFHFFEVNRALHFDRAAAYGMRLNIASGTAVRFEPGDEKEVTLTALAGGRIAHGGSGLVAGALDDAQVKAAALARLDAFARKDGD
jgi:urease beta subunit